MVNTKPKPARKSPIVASARFLNIKDDDIISHKDCKKFNSNRHSISIDSISKLESGRKMVKMCLNDHSVFKEPNYNLEQFQPQGAKVLNNYK